MGMKFRYCMCEIVSGTLDITVEGQFRMIIVAI
jgi:hypothetical protein